MACVVMEESAGVGVLSGECHSRTKTKEFKTIAGESRALESKTRLGCGGL